MAGIDFYQSVDLDTSVILKYPREMTTVLTNMQDLLKSKGKLIIDEGDITVKRARELAAQATGDLTSIYQIRSSDNKIWDVLKESIEADRIRVLGLIHGAMPSSVPENVIVLDVGQSLHRKASRSVISSLVESLLPKNAGKFPTGVRDVESLYYAVQALCYERLYNSEYRMFPKNLSRQIPRSEAFTFMYNPPDVLTEQTMKAAVYGFVERSHSGWMV